MIALLFDILIATATPTPHPKGCAVYPKIWNQDKARYLDGTPAPERTPTPTPDPISVLVSPAPEPGECRAIEGEILNVQCHDGRHRFMRILNETPTPLPSPQSDADCRARFGPQSYYQTCPSSACWGSGIHGEACYQASDIAMATSTATSTPDCAAEWRKLNLRCLGRLNPGCACEIQNVFPEPAPTPKKRKIHCEVEAKHLIRGTMDGSTVDCEVEQ